MPGILEEGVEVKAPYRFHTLLPLVNFTLWQVDGFQQPELPLDPRLGEWLSSHLPQVDVQAQVRLEVFVKTDPGVGVRKDGCTVDALSDEVSVRL